MPSAAARTLGPRTISQSANPITPLLESGRGFISGEPVLALAAFAIVAGLIVGFCFWAVRGLRSAEAAG